MKDPATVRCSDLQPGITQVRWDAHTWTAWAPAPETASWWLVRLRDGVAVYASVPCREMAYLHTQLEIGDDE